MKLKLIVVLGVLALVAAACGSSESTTTTAAPTTTATTEPPGGQTTTTAMVDEGPLAMYGESTDADPALVAKALGPVTPSDEASWNIILASIARANQDLDDATIAKAMECFNNQECDTGSGGDLIMGYADGGGDTVNVWRAVSHMEAILQALTYPEIGTIVSTEANFDTNPQTHIDGVQFLIDRGVDFIVGYPDIGVGLREVLLAANAAGIPYASFSAGWVGLSDQDGALVPGQDYLTVVGEDLCALGESFAAVLDDNLPDGTKVALLGGSTGNALTLGWQRCIAPALEADGLTIVNPPPDANTTVGDTFWYDPAIPGVYEGLLTQDPDIKGWAYEYSDGQYIGTGVMDQRDYDYSDVTVALRTDEQSLFCDWVDRGVPTYNIFYSAGGNFQSRTAVTASILALQDESVVPATVIVPHVMRQISADDCDENRAHASVSGTSLVPDEVLTLMFQGG